MMERPAQSLSIIIFFDHISFKPRAYPPLMLKRLFTCPHPKIKKAGSLKEPAWIQQMVFLRSTER
jgi:hypothetical protein